MLFQKLFFKLQFVLYFFLMPVFVFAQTNSGKIDNPLGQNATICGLVKTLLTAVFYIGLPVTVFFIAFAGFKFVTAQGNPSKLDDAKRTFLYVVIGIAVFFGAWVIAGVITNTINPFIALSGGQLISSSCGR